MENASPIPGVDYPRTFDEMDDWFRTEAQCRDYIRRLCWPNGFVCERCGAAGEPWVTARGVFRCKDCDGSTSLTAGTVFQDTHKPLRTWFLNVVHHQSEEWHERFGVAAGTWVG